MKFKDVLEWVGTHKGELTAVAIGAVSIGVAAVIKSKHYLVPKSLEYLAWHGDKSFKFSRKEVGEFIDDPENQSRKYIIVKSDSNKDEYDLFD